MPRKWYSSCLFNDRSTSLQVLDSKEFRTRSKTRGQFVTLVRRLCHIPLWRVWSWESRDYAIDSWSNGSIDTTLLIVTDNPPHAQHRDQLDILGFLFLQMVENHSFQVEVGLPVLNIDTTPVEVSLSPSTCTNAQASILLWVSRPFPMFLSPFYQNTKAEQMDMHKKELDR